MKENNCMAFAAMNKKNGLFGKIIDILPYTNVQNHLSFWKMTISKEQSNKAREILKTKDIFLNIPTLKEVDEYFNDKEALSTFNLTGKDIFLKDEFGEYVYFITKDKEVV